METSPILSIDDWQKRLQTSETQGLSPGEAEARLKRDGFNELEEKKVNPLLKFLGYFWGPIPWMIEIAVILSAVVRHWSDFGIILTLLVINAIVGFWEEFQAGNAIAALKAKLALQAKVMRGGLWQQVSARALVVGDLIRIRLGDIIPADAVLLGTEPVEIDQSALTGESLPVVRKRGDAVYSGSVLKQGETDAWVSGTGKNTYLGKTASLVQSAESVSHFQKAVLKIGDFLVVFALVLVGLILVTALLRGDPLLTTLQFALVLTVAAVPVAMPTVLSVTMAVGARFLSRRQAIVSRLASIEELAGMDVLCSDKTGTLTQNRLSLGPAFLLSGVTEAQILEAAGLASRAEDHDSIDDAVLQGIKDPLSLKSYKILKYQPFDPIHKRTEAAVQGPDGKIFSVSKGAPQTVLALNPPSAEISAQVQAAIQDFAKKGFRALGVAQKTGDGPWQLLGILPLYDPPRPDSKETIQTAKQMGIQIKMVTGDQVAIAEEIAAELGLGTRILDAAILSDKKNTAENLEKEIEGSDGFAQVFPEHKFQIVQSLQRAGHIVGMTGDGVNDAPALKEANCGIAVSNATDAARAAASMVLITPGLSVIITALQEARRIFQRMNSYAMYRIAETLRILLFMTLSILVFNFYPVTAIMIVLLALLNDGAILTIAYDRVEYPNHPEAWNMKKVLGVATCLGVLGVIETFGLYYLAERYWHLSQALIQTMIYLKFSVSGHMTVMVTRTRGPFWSIAPAPILLGAVTLTQLIATLISVYGLFMSPLGWHWAGIVWAYCFFWFLVEDRVKLLALKIFAPQE